MAAYSATPFFKQNQKILTEAFEDEPKHLADININLIKKISNLLSYKTDFFRSSELPVSGKGNDYNLKLCQHFGATHYLSGKGAKNYQDENAFEEAGIKINYNDFYSYLSNNSYPQNQSTFINGLSVVDALFNIGVNGVVELLKNYQD